MDVLGEQLLAGTGGSDDEDWEARPSVPLGQRRGTTEGRGYSNDHRSSPFGNRGAVTLSASASVLRIRGVRNK